MNITKINIFFISAIVSLTYSIPIFAQNGVPKRWSQEWSKTDSSNSSIKFSDILSGGPAKDGIPSIDNPKFKLVSEVKNKNNEPVISLKIGNDVRAYPLSILMFHEIVNDTVGGVPVAVTYCPLCNAGIVFKRIVNGKTLDFGTTGKLRYSDMIMYDRQTESWWQQFIGEGIIGKYNNVKLEKIRSRIESFSLFKKAFPQGKVLVAENGLRNYGSNPYVNYDSSEWPFLFNGKFKGKVPPLSRVVSIGNDAWPLKLLREKGKIIYNDLVITWVAGQNSALDNHQINKGRDIGNVIVQRYGENNSLEDVTHLIPFAFAFKAFKPEGIIHDK